MFKSEKTLAAVKYVYQQTKAENLTVIFNALFQANLLHNQKYGRFITVDKWIVVESGAIPEMTSRLVFEKVTMSGGCIATALGDAIDMDEFNKSDLECLDLVIKADSLFPLADAGICCQCGEVMG